MSWPAGCFDRVLLGLGSSNTWLQPEAPGQPGALWARRGCRPEGSTGCFRSASHCGRSGSSLDIHKRTTVRRCAAQDSVNSSKLYLVTCIIIMRYCNNNGLDRGLLDLDSKFDANIMWQISFQTSVKLMMRPLQIESAQCRENVPSLSVNTSFFPLNMAFSREFSLVSTCSVV